MRKIPTLFVRDYSDPLAPVLTEEVTPGCEWVLAGEGVAHRKYDGQTIEIRFDGLGHATVWHRKEVKPGVEPPPGFEPSMEPDPRTGKVFGWLPVASSPWEKYVTQALAADYLDFKPLLAGTYELVGPKVNGNPEGYESHRLVRHADTEMVRPFALTFAGIRSTVLTLRESDGYEGLVWHHPDGRMAKIKARDYV